MDLIENEAILDIAFGKCPKGPNQNGPQMELKWSQNAQKCLPMHNWKQIHWIWCQRKADHLLNKLSEKNWVLFRILKIAFVISSLDL